MVAATETKANADTSSLRMGGPHGDEGNPPSIIASRRAPHVEKARRPGAAPEPQRPELPLLMIGQAPPILAVRERGHPHALRPDDDPRQGPGAAPVEFPQVVGLFRPRDHLRQID